MSATEPAGRRKDECGHPEWQAPAQMSRPNDRTIDMCSSSASFRLLFDNLIIVYFE
jgi:hypothetical protein